MHVTLPILHGMEFRLEHVESDQTGGIFVSSDLFPIPSIFWVSCQVSSRPTRLAMSTALNITVQLTVSLHLPLKVDITIDSAVLRLHSLQEPPTKSICNIRISKIDLEIGLVDVVAQVGIQPLCLLYNLSLLLFIGVSKQHAKRVFAHRIVAVDPRMLESSAHPVFPSLRRRRLS
jgi:hypothetical protein